MTAQSEFTYEGVNYIFSVTLSNGVTGWEIVYDLLRQPRYFGVMPSEDVRAWMMQHKKNVFYETVERLKENISAWITSETT